MATKSYEPTMNLYALLAEEPTNQPQTRKAKADPKKTEAELTPKERAAAKAAQDAERKAKREVELKAKQEAEAAQRKALTDLVQIDDTGFSQQRHQRIKDSRAPQVQEVAKPAKGNKSDKTDKPNKGKFEKGTKKFDKQDKPAAAAVGNFETKEVAKDGKAFKQEGQVQGGNRPPRREFDRHSQGVNPRQAKVKKGGHGRGNWDKTVSDTVTKTSTDLALTTEAPAEEVENWDSVATATPVEGTEDVQKVEAPADDKNEEEEEEVDNTVTLDEFWAQQEEKKKELEAKLGSGAAKVRELTDDEKRAAGKFQLVENQKAKTDAKTEAAVKVNPTAAARKGTKPVALDEVFTVKVNGPRPTNWDAPRPQRQGPRDRPHHQGNVQKKTRPANKPAKIRNNDTQFPTLG